MSGLKEIFRKAVAAVTLTAGLAATGVGVYAGTEVVRNYQDYRDNEAVSCLRTVTSGQGTCQNEAAYVKAIESQKVEKNLLLSALGMSSGTSMILMASGAAGSGRRRGQG